MLAFHGMQFKSIRLRTSILSREKDVRKIIYCVAFTCHNADKSD